jgi:hypothetical protein
MRDAVVFGMMVLGFATFVTAHLVLLVVLTIWEKPRWRGPVALLLPPLAPMWAWRAGRKFAASCWALGLVVYAIGIAINQLS